MDAETRPPPRRYVLSDKEALSLEKWAFSAASRHVLRLGRPWEDVYDVQQELLAALLSRLHKFNEERGNVYQFASRIFKNRISELGREYFKSRLLELPLIERSGREPVVADDHAGTDLRLDIGRGLRVLRSGDAVVIDALLADDPVVFSRSKKIAKSTFYRVRQETRRRLRMIGLAA